MNRVGLALCAGNTAEAEDLVSAAIAASLPHWDRITGSPLAYVRRTMVNTFFNSKRHESVSAAHAALVGEQIPTPTDPVEQADLRRDTERWLAALPPRHRAVLVLRFLADQSVTDTARTLGVPAGSVKRLTHEALSALRASRAGDDYRGVTTQRGGPDDQ